jgi:hypothetical protein
MASSSKYRSVAIAQQVIAFSISYQREDLLARGLGVDHLRELLVRLARPLLRQGANLAYGGNWKESEDNLTYELLRLISAEQEDASVGESPTGPTIGRLYNHLAWPHYLEVTPLIEAQWITCCRIVRVTQADADFAPTEIIAADDVASNSVAVRFNTACCLSAMRRLMHEAMTIAIPDAQTETIPAVMGRIALGGKTSSFSGFVPGVFEEALVAFEKNCPLYLIGGFGGATEVLTRALLTETAALPPEFTVEQHEKMQPGYSELMSHLQKARLPTRARAPQTVLTDLWQRITAARASLAASLNTGLTEDETRELMTTRDMQAAIRLVKSGIAKRCNLPQLPA